MECRWALPACFAPFLSIQANKYHRYEEEDIDTGQHQPGILELDFFTEGKAVTEIMLADDTTQRWARYRRPTQKTNVSLTHKS
jgi:hypothetical protein